MKRFLIVLLLLLTVGLVVLKLLVFELPKIAGNDMAPALQPGDLMLANRLSTPERGDLVLFEHPEVASRVLIRRVVGLPGERVTVTREVPAVGGKRLTRKVLGEVELKDAGETSIMKLVEERLPGSTPPWQVFKDPKRRSVDPKPVALGTGQYYVLSDNRNHGTDSRTFGPIHRDKIRSVVTHRVSAGPGSVTPQPKRDGWHRLR